MRPSATGSMLEGQKVAEVAAAYGCTPANIYAILARLRRQGAQAPGDVLPSASTAEPAPAAVPAEPTCRRPLRRTGRGKAGGILPSSGGFGPDRAGAASDGARPPCRRGHRARVAAGSAGVTRPIRSGRAAAAPRSSLSSPTPRTGKAGYALLMRTSDGEEAVHPFRLSTSCCPPAKPILRTAARSPEPIWFSIQPVDLEALEDSF